MTRYPLRATPIDTLLPHPPLFRPPAIPLFSTAAEALAVQERFFDDFEPGQTFDSKGVTLSESQILDFAMLYDPQPFHLDKEAAAEGPFNGLIASGFQTLAVAFRIFYQANVINACSMGSPRSEEHTSELQSLMRISYAVFCLKK